jgi:hypothetical protein
VKSGGKPRPGKTQTNRFSRVGPTLVAWMQAQEEGNEGSLEDHFQKELKDRGHITQDSNCEDKRNGSSGQTRAPKKMQTHVTTPTAELPKVRPSDNESDDSGVDESEACSDFGTMSDAVGDEDDGFSEASYAEREADYGSSEDECYQIDGKRVAHNTQRAFSIRSRRSIVRPILNNVHVHTLKEEDFVPE